MDPLCIKQGQKLCGFLTVHELLDMVKAGKQIGKLHCINVLFKSTKGGGDTALYGW